MSEAHRERTIPLNLRDREDGFFFFRASDVAAISPQDEKRDTEKGIPLTLDDPALSASASLPGQKAMDTPPEVSF